MTETTTFIHQVMGNLRSNKIGEFTAEFEVEGKRRVLSGRFDSEIHPPLRASRVTLHFERPDHLRGGFFIDINGLHAVGPNNIRLSFIKPGFDPIRFLIDGPLDQILPRGILVEGDGDWSNV